MEEPEIPVDTDDPLAARILADKRRDELESEALRRSAELHALQEARAAAVADVSSKMSGQAQAMMSAWGSVPMQGYQQGDFSAATLMDAEQQAMAETLEAEAEAGVPPGQVILKSGDIMYATLETGINSDEPSPIMARIVHGPLKGAKLIGSMEPVSQESEKIVITFHSINIANQPQSYGISAVAIDPETARTAIATKVDKHYLSRYGALFASSFIAGYSKAIAEAGTSTTEEGTGDTAKTTTTNTGNQTSKQEIHSGLSKVADAWSETVAQNIERNPTITVKSGTSIGVLLTGDLQLGISPEEPGNESLSSEPIAAEE